METREALNLANTVKVYRTGAGDFEALRSVSLRVAAGQMTAISGKSGSGKSTLLNLITGIDHATSGTVTVGGRLLNAMSENELAAWRGTAVGIVFQFFQLIPTLTIAENIMLPMELNRRGSSTDRRERALALLDLVSIADQADKFPSSLSGGQQQRAAIARALANDAPLIVADEPTGNLDSATSETIFKLFRHLADTGRTVVVVTHEPGFRDYFDRVVTLADGQITSGANP